MADKKKQKPAKRRKPVWKPKPGEVSRFPPGVSGNPNGRPKSKKKKSVGKKETIYKKKKKPITGNKPVWKPKPGIPSRFPKGTSGNPNGRPKGTKNRYAIADLWDAVKRVESKKGKKRILVAFVEQAYSNPGIMVALMRKLLPDLKSIEGTLTTFEASMDDELAKAIQNKLRRRYGRENKKGIG